MFTSLLNRFIRSTAMLVLAAGFMLQAKAENYSDLWYNPEEPGWGVTIADHNTNIFAVWLTYREDNTPTWFVIPGGTLSDDRRTFTASIYSTNAPLDESGQVDLSALEVTGVGSATFDFAPADLPAGQARFTYTVGDVSGSKAIQRQSFGDAAPNWGMDLTDMWFNPEQDGWGVSLTQHGSTTFAVVYTYDTTGRPTFYVMSEALYHDATLLTGRIYSTQGTYFARTYDAANTFVSDVGGGGLILTGFAPIKGDDGGLCPCAPNSLYFNSVVQGNLVQSPLEPMIYGEEPQRSRAKVRAMFSK
jgi:endo-chitodextinase